MPGLDGGGGGGGGGGVRMGLVEFLGVWDLLEPVGYYSEYAGRLEAATRALARERDVKMMAYRLDDLHAELLALGCKEGDLFPITDARVSVKEAVDTLSAKATQLSPPLAEAQAIHQTLMALATADDDSFPASEARALAVLSSGAAGAVGPVAGRRRPGVPAPAGPAGPATVGAEGSDAAARRKKLLLRLIRRQYVLQASLLEAERLTGRYLPLHGMPAPKLTGTFLKVEVLSASLTHDLRNPFACADEGKRINESEMRLRVSVSLLSATPGILPQSTPVVEQTRNPEWDALLFFEMCTFDEVDVVRLNHKTVDVSNLPGILVEVKLMMKNLGTHVISNVLVPYPKYLDRDASQIAYFDLYPARKYALAPLKLQTPPAFPQASRTKAQRDMDDDTAAEAAPKGGPRQFASGSLGELMLRATLLSRGVASGASGKRGRRGRRRRRVTVADESEEAAGGDDEDEEAGEEADGGLVASASAAAAGLAEAILGPDPRIVDDLADKASSEVLERLLVNIFWDLDFFMDCRPLWRLDLSHLGRGVSGLAIRGVLLCFWGAGLRSVSLSGLPVDDDELILLAVAAPDSLRELDVSGCHGVTDRSLARVARSCSSLTRLDLRDTSPSVTDGTLLVCAHMPSLTDLGAGYLPSASCMSLAQCIAHPRMQVLDVSGCPRVDDSLFRILLPPRAPDQLVTGNNPATAVASEGQLVELSGGVPRVAMAASVGAGRRLRSLSLAFCDGISPQGLRDLSMASRHLQSLRRLSLAHCVGAIDGAAVAAVLASIVGAKGAIHQTDPTVRELFRELSDNLPGLTDVDLTATGVEDPAIARLLRACPRLQILKMTLCAQITEDLILELERQALALRELEILSVPRWTLGGLRTLIRRMPACKVTADLGRENPATACPRVLPGGFFRRPVSPGDDPPPPAPAPSAAAAARGLPPRAAPR